MNKNKPKYVRKLTAWDCLIRECKRRMKGDCPKGLCRKHCIEYCMDMKEGLEKRLEGLK